MNREIISEKCLALPGAVEDYQEAWGAWRYRVGNKMFALIGVYQQREIVSLKCDPFYALELREGYTDIFPGYYLSKAHWNSIYLDGDVPEELVVRLISDSYHLIFNSLTKNIKKELTS